MYLKNRKFICSSRLPSHRHENDQGVESSPDHLWTTFLSYRESRHRLGEMISNLEGERAYGEGRHQQFNEIPFMSFRGIGYYQPL